MPCPRVSQLDIAGDESPTRPLAASLLTAIRALADSTNTLISQVKPLQPQAGSWDKLPVDDISAFLHGTELLTEITSKLQAHAGVLNDAIERIIMTQLVSLGSQGVNEVQRTRAISKMLSHFDERIREIVRDVLDDNGRRDLLLRVAEACYKEAVDPHGKLNIDDYFAALDEAALKRRYGRDFANEQRYEHENRVDVDGNEADSFQKRSERKRAGEERRRSCWYGFWVNALNNIPDGPTLFNPPTNTRFDTIVPRYLFRTFDQFSAGYNSENEISSGASILPSAASRTDIFSLERMIARLMLHRHLEGKPDEEHPDTNLVSWTSSFLYAMQCAIWRRRRFGATRSEIKICMVDTSKFPRGQFARDICLINTYHDRQMDDEAANFFNFRLKKEEYYNGEFLSQGTLNLVDRSCVVSLEGLIEAGIFEMYPEFEDVGGEKLWANRVKALRQIWSSEQKTSDEEIDLSLKIAQECFSSFEALDIACILLTLKDRECSVLKSKSKPCSIDASTDESLTKDLDQFEQRRPKSADKPKEVCRCWTVTEAMKPEEETQNPEALMSIVPAQRTLRETFN
ncbi:hypothetical protein FKW77_005683 [Venturia effusa]|uniref:DUF7587 domain-containing protein n=1 Tax=Venturia effusa TaxID=50376 RepID=A0A517LFJ9_9PEZI|nr:hypothetical protein FKW77_005683 [Venturia effusa]